MQKLLHALYKAILPDHVKRIIFCVTVYGHIASITGYRLGDQELTRLNRVLKLAQNVKGMVFPIAWSDAIWASIPTPPLNDAKRKTFIDSVLLHTPSYLFYERAKMETDLTGLLQVFFDEKKSADEQRGLNQSA